MSECQCWAVHGPASKISPDLRRIFPDGVPIREPWALLTGPDRWDVYWSLDTSRVRADQLLELAIVAGPGTGRPIGELLGDTDSIAILADDTVTLTVCPRHTAQALAVRFRRDLERSEDDD